MYKILIIEDDQTISGIIAQNLNKWNYQVQKTEDFRDILPEFTAFQPHLVLLDINLPYYDGYYWCSRIRELSNTPIIFISSRDGDADKIRAISQGGDDYLEKPFSMDLLIAKVQATLRRAYSYTDQTLNTLEHQGVVLDIAHLRVAYQEQTIELTKNECRILTFLMRNGDKPVSRSRLIKALWDDESFVDDNTLTVNVNRLRRKLKTIGLERFIKTIKGEGYSLN